jgi:hypothetical protein
MLMVIQTGGPGGLRSHDFRLSPVNLEGRRSVQTELRALVHLRKVHLDGHSEMLAFLYKMLFVSG